MKVIATIAELRAALRIERLNGKTIGLVPTMGYLHIGHMTLVRHSRAASDITVVSIFVNPTQFGPNEDLAAYPRDMAGDLAKLESEGVDYVFTPDVSEVYRPGANTIVENPVLSRVLIGKIRPGHFRGVTTVVTKLFNIVQPDQAFFGEKDYQQLTIIRQMVADLDVPTEITGVATVREADGLACSSRNALLTPSDRKAAVILAKSLAKAEEMVAQGLRSVSAIRNAVRAVLQTEKRGEIESVDVRDARTLDPLSGKFRQPVVILLTVRFGKVRLIDQRVIG
ncbi:pantoate--beta-alanine ligase [Phyllobacterium endophyticum]|uniref:Pantothenate synthetase n=1 Tax=Phyllobacterium endophyticum TaxID=1149773 RepID=A0A2P7AWQ5_9HYPH|nr:pantoate--beta-alanine ligase [Phyllobacterium endophyticum]MBB3235276.1 pantoate--beta-alanine ligase [Phyllobacterium endophyticum]PSH58640.1 pantoate--beta-alanine ligase [Phyllobacterium endophyticum]TYR39329.1 pantoate--beta-alanine ligase [Phyllobacterium endophyticum]